MKAVDVRIRQKFQIGFKRILKTDDEEYYHWLYSYLGMFVRGV